MDDPIISLPCVWSDNNTSISSLENEPQHHRRCHRPQSLLEHLCPTQRKRELCVACEVPGFLFYLVLEDKCSIAISAIKKLSDK